MHVNFGTGQYVPGGVAPTEVHAECVPRIIHPGDPLVIWCHEHGATARYWPSAFRVQACYEVVDYFGFTGSSADLGGVAAWASPTVMQRITNLFTFMKARYPVRADKFILMGGSMGGLAVLNYAHLHPENVLACLSLIPPVSLPWHYANGTPPVASAAATAAELDTAYVNHAGYLAALADHSPYERMTAPDVPTCIWTSDDDVTTNSPLAVEYAATTGIEHHSMGAVGHTFAGGTFSLEWARWLRDQANG